MAPLPKPILFGLLYGLPLSVLEGRTPSTLRWVPIKPLPAPSTPQTVVYVASKDERKKRKKTKARLKKKRGY